MNTDLELTQRYLEQPGTPLWLDQNPLGRALKAQLVHVDREAGKAVLDFDLDSTFTQGAGVIQGGIVTALLDFGLAYCVMAKLPEQTHPTTTSLNTHYERAALPGRYRVEGELNRLGRRVAFASATLHALPDTNRVIARATAVMALVELER